MRKKELQETPSDELYLSTSFLEVALTILEDFPDDLKSSIQIGILDLNPFPEENTILQVRISGDFTKLHKAIRQSLGDSCLLRKQLSECPKLLDFIQKQKE